MAVVRCERSRYEGLQEAGQTHLESVYSVRSHGTLPSHVKTPLPTNRTASQSLMCVVEYTSREVRARTSSYGTLCFAYVGDGRSVYVLGKGAMRSVELWDSQCACPG